jgi:hypothetical protein
MVKFRAAADNNKFRITAHDSGHVIVTISEGGLSAQTHVDKHEFLQFAQLVDQVRAHLHEEEDPRPKMSNEELNALLSELVEDE